MEDALNRPEDEIEMVEHRPLQQVEVEIHEYRPDEQAETEHAQLDAALQIQDQEEPPAMVIANIVSWLE